MREDWVETSLSDIYEIVTGNTPSKKDKNNYGGDIPFIKPPDINNGPLSTASEYLSSQGASKGRVLPPNSILITCIGNLGRVTINKDPIAFNQQINALKPASNIDSKFTYYVAQSSSFINQLESKSTSTTVALVNKGNFSTIKVPLAPLPEQRAIVAKIEQLFSSLDQGIADLKKAQDQLKVYRQAVLKKAFEGELTKEWREQQTDLPTADELLEQIKAERQKHYEQQLEDWKQAVKVWEENGKDGKKPGKPKKLIAVSNLTQDELDNLQTIPTEWLYSYLAFAGELARGKSKHRPRNDPKLFDNGKYPFIQTGDVKAQKIITTFDKKYSEFGLQQSKLWKKGTLCITIAANIAETGFLGIDACFPDSIVGFTPFTGVIRNNFIEYFFQLAKNRISAYAPATAQKNINLTILENLVVPFCSIKEQHQIVQEIESRLSVCDKVEKDIALAIERSRNLRQSILKKAFEGSLLTEEEIADCKAAADYEPASVLLEKIKVNKYKK